LLMVAEPHSTGPSRKRFDTHYNFLMSILCYAVSTASHDANNRQEAMITDERQQVLRAYCVSTHLDTACSCWSIL
jgi:hypothetical protein